MGVFGAGSQVWSEEQTLAYLHADLLFAVFRAELALSAAQQAQLASKRAHAAAAAAASNRSGHGATSVGALPLPPPRPSGACEARLQAECGHNHSWRALLSLAMLPYRDDAADAAAQRALLREARSSLAQNDAETDSLLQRIQGTFAATVALQEAQEGRRPQGQTKPPSNRKSSVASRGSSHAAAGASPRHTPAAAASATLPSPVYITRGSNFITVRPRAYAFPPSRGGQRGKKRREAEPAYVRCCRIVELSCANPCPSLPADTTCCTANLPALAQLSR